MIEFLCRVLVSKRVVRSVDVSERSRWTVDVDHRGGRPRPGRDVEAKNQRTVTGNHRGISAAARKQGRRGVLQSHGKRSGCSDLRCINGSGGVRSGESRIRKEDRRLNSHGSLGERKAPHAAGTSSRSDSSSGANSGHGSQGQTRQRT